MRLWKKALSVLLVSATAISMCACGGAKKGSGSSDTFKIGGIGPTTGDAAIYGMVFSLLLMRSTKTAVSMVRRSNINLKMTKTIQRNLLMLTTA